MTHRRTCIILNFIRNMCHVSCVRVTVRRIVYSVPNILYAVCCTMYDVQYKWYIACRELVTVHCSVQCTAYTIATVHYSLYSVHRIVCIAYLPFTVYSVYCTLYNVQIVQYAVYTVHCTVFNIQYTLYIVYCTLYNAQCTI